MSDSKRATLITVGASNSGKTNVTKTVRLSINLDESNESKYPELNYKELVIAEERKKKAENGKTAGLDPFSDNDDDVERVARKFEQKYGGKRTYGKKGRRKRDDFADIGAGYDENDSFIDNTDGYDEMFPPEVDTYLGGFYINSGLLEFKAAPETQSTASEAVVERNKRRISSSSSSDSSDSSSGSESGDEAKAAQPVANGAVDSHKTEHRKKKNKAIEKKAKKIRRTDSSAATSGKQTSDDNGHGDGESADSRTSQSDSLTSKPAPSSENAITSDSSRDTEAKDMKLPSIVSKALEEFEVATRSCKLLNNADCELDSKLDPFIVKLQRALSEAEMEPGVQRWVWARAGRLCRAGRARLGHRARALALAPAALDADKQASQPANTSAAPALTSTTVVSKPASLAAVTISTVPTTSTQNNKRKADNIIEEDFSNLTAEQREAKIVDALAKLKQLIDEKKPGMVASYNAECERVQEERKKLMALAGEGGPAHVEKRLPKRRFPWCGRARALLARLRALAGDAHSAHALMSCRVLPLFPAGFVRMPTLLRQADLNKEVKSDAKRQRIGTSSQPAPVLQNPSTGFTEPIQFPSSLTVTTSLKSSTVEKNDVSEDRDQKKSNSTTIFGSILNSFSLNKDLVIEKEDIKDPIIVEKSKEELYIPPNSIGSITITAVPNQTKPEKKNSNILNDKKEPLIRVKSPAALNEMANKKEKNKKYDKNPKDKRIDTPLHIDTSHQTNKKEPSPNLIKPEEISQKQIETMRVAENNIPRPALVPVHHHSPTFIKPDKRPPETKRKKDVLIVSDLDPLGDIQPEPLCVDDSSSDIEVIEDGKIKNELKSSENKSDSVPSKDKVSARDVNHKKDSLKCKDRVVSNKDGKHDSHKNKAEDQTNLEIDAVMRSLRVMEHSQENKKYNSNSYGGVITSAKQDNYSKESFSRSGLLGAAHSDKDKLTSFFEQNGWM